MLRRLAAAITFCPAVAVAEVSDKIASIPVIWVQGAIIGAIVSFAAWFRWWLAFPAVLFALFLVFGMLDLWADPYMREAILHEHGSVYFVTLASEIALIVIGAAFGAWFGYARNRRGDRSVKRTDTSASTTQRPKRN